MATAVPTHVTNIGSRAFLQRRVASFGLLSGLFFAGFWALRMVHMIVGPEDGSPWASHEFDHSLIFHLLASVFLLGTWLATRWGPMSSAAVRAVEATGLILTTIAVSLTTMSLPLASRPDFMLILAMTLALTIRAIYVPSSWRRSLVLASVMGVIVLVAIYQMWLALDVDAWANVQPQMIEYQASDAASALAANAALWWAGTTITTTAASMVIYGLRKDVQEAKQLGQYRLEAKLGEGGMGVVFQAQHALLRRPTAVKLLLPEKAGERSIERFEREVQLMAKLRHPHTVTVFDYGRTPDNVFYYAMELIDGATLDDIVEATGPMEVNRAVTVMMQAAAAMVEAHGVGLIHRDIKPANMMLHLPHEHGGIHESVKLLDFGLVKTVEGDDDGPKEGMISGTPQYMAPEAIRDPDNIDARVDVYALGCVLFFLLTGEHVFDGKDVMEVCAQHLSVEPDTVEDRLGEPVDPQLEALIADCLEKDRNQRIESAAVLYERLAEIDVDEFTARDAREWWAEYGDVLHESTAPTEAMLTMDIARARGHA